MNELRQQVAMVRRRLIVQQFMAALVWCWFATLAVAALAIGIQKWLLTSVDGWQWALCWIGGGVVAGFLAALVWTWFVRLPELQAAIEIDHRFGLKERVSSSLALTPDEIESPFGRALLDDAQRRIGNLEVAGRFPIQLERRAWLPLIPAAMAFALCFLADPTQRGAGDAQANTVAIKKQIDESVKPLQKKLEERSKQAAEEGLKDAADLFKKIDEGTRDLAKKDEGDRREALSKLNDLSKQLDERREKLAASEKLKDQLAGMKNLPGGPADKLAKDLKNGDFSKALKEIAKLQEQLSQGQLDPQKQKELAEQLTAMKDSLQKMADAHEKAKQDLQKQIAKAKQSGDEEAAKNLQAQLNKLQQQQPQMDRMKDMASKLGECSQCLKQGKSGQAQAAMNQLASNLSQMQQEMAELQMLEASLDEIDEAKSAMTCSNCNGEGCELCRKHSNAFSDHGRQVGAEGERPEKAEGTKYYDSKVKQNIGHGASIVSGLIEGPNAKGQVVEEIKNQMVAAKHDLSDPLTGQRLPRDQRDHVQQYFDAFRKGE